MLFDLGFTSITPGAVIALAARGATPASLVARHVSGDWGDVDAHDRAANAAAVAQGGRVLSAYGAEGDPARVWVLTEADRSATTILTPAEY